jgi:hypothetical protein
MFQKEKNCHKFVVPPATLISFFVGSHCMKLASCEIRIKSTKSGSELVPIHRVVLMHGHTGHEHRAHANLCILCKAYFLMLKHWFCRKYQYNKFMVNFIDIYIFIPVSCCIGFDLSALLCPGAYNAAKTALPIHVCLQSLFRTVWRG